MRITNRQGIRLLRTTIADCLTDGKCRSLTG
jgi:hypothetical protein